MAQPTMSTIINVALAVTGDYRILIKTGLFVTWVDVQVNILRQTA
jgi:hypothetical protein